ncbi:MAG TPA: hypothetical protein VFS21_31555 [Roseiflexaceae bacterium]|nr:hypothetical protein [Roseiflexaceae bacterium]
MRNNTTTEQYTCPNCGYTNVWTRDEILQRGKEIVFRGDDEVIYSLRCKNPSGCAARMRVAIDRRGGQPCP